MWRKKSANLGAHVINLNFSFEKEKVYKFERKRFVFLSTPKEVQLVNKMIRVEERNIEKVPKIRANNLRVMSFSLNIYRRIENIYAFELQQWELDNFTWLIFR